MRQAFGSLAAVAVAAVAALTDQPAKSETITIHAEAWENYTNQDGTGFAWDVLRAVYNPEGLTLETKIVPYARAVDNVVNGNADAWVASYHNENPKAVYPEWHYDADRVVALYVPARVADPADASDLDGHRVAWVRGYELEKYIDVPMKVSKINKQESALEMLKIGTVDYFLDSRYVVENMLSDLPDELTKDMFDHKHVANLPLYMAFAPTERGRKLAEIWDERFPKLLKNGTIAELYDAYGWTIWPFERPRGDPGS